MLPKKKENARKKYRRHEEAERLAAAKETGTSEKLEAREDAKRQPGMGSVQDAVMPFETEKEVVVQVHIRESSLEWFKKLMEARFIRYEVV